MAEGWHPSGSFTSLRVTNMLTRSSFCLLHPAQRLGGASQSRRALRAVLLFSVFHLRRAEFTSSARKVMTFGRQLLCLGGAFELASRSHWRASQASVLQSHIRVHSANYTVYLSLGAMSLSTPVPDWTTRGGALAACQVCYRAGTSIQGSDHPGFRVMYATLIACIPLNAGRNTPFFLVYIPSSSAS